ncbi:MAG: hypothetical protein ACRDZO_28835 [Egibacteraceae bacterium]
MTPPGLLTFAARPDALAVPASHEDESLFSLAEVNVEELLEDLGIIERDEEPEDEDEDRDEEPSGDFEASFTDGEASASVTGGESTFRTDGRSESRAHSDDDEPVLSLFNVDVPFLPFGESLFSLLEVD